MFYNKKTFHIFRRNVKKNFKILLKLFFYLWQGEKNIRFCIMLGITFMIGGVFLNIGVPLVLKYLVNSLEKTTFSSFYIMFLLFLYGVIWIFSKIILSFKEIVIFKVIERSLRKLNSQMMNHLNNLSFEFHLQRKTGELTTALERTQSAIPIIFYGVVFMIFPIVIEIVIASAIFWKMYGFSYSLILFVVFVFFTFFVSLASRQMNLYRKLSNKFNQKASRIFVDSLLNFEVVRYFGKQNHELEIYSDILEERENAELKSLLFFELIHVGQNIILGIGLILLNYIMCKGILDGNRNVADLVFVNSLIFQFFVPLSSFGVLFKKTYRAFADVEYIFNIFSVNPSIKDLPNAKPLMPKSGAIKFQTVSFSYIPSNIILDNLSFYVPEGKRVAIVGETGEGKSTIVKLLYRFYDVSSGKIFIDGQNIKEVKQRSISDIIGVVPQDTILFNNTIAYNIAYGKLNTSQKEIEDVAKAVKLSKLINSLPKKYDTIVGERGLKLSGGEKQKVAIARVLLKKPLIYIFDEATSSLDVETEKTINKIIDSIAKNKTTLIISHRLSAVINADKIFFLKKGRIIENGSHRELIEKKGGYAEFWQQRKKDFHDMNYSI